MNLSVSSKRSIGFRFFKIGIRIFFKIIYGSVAAGLQAFTDYITANNLEWDEAAFEKFMNLEFWMLLFGVEENKPFHLSQIINHFKHLDRILNELNSANMEEQKIALEFISKLEEKFTNPDQYEAVLKLRSKKSKIVLMLFKPIAALNLLGKADLKKEFDISDETRSKWLKFIKENNLLEKDLVAQLLEKEEDNELQFLSKSYSDKKTKMSLFDYWRVLYILNGDNPTSVMVFSKKHVSYILKESGKNLYKNITYEAFGAAVTFEKFPFTIFKEILKNNDYVFCETDFKEDFEAMIKTIS